MVPRPNFSIEKYWQWLIFLQLDRSENLLSRHTPRKVSESPVYHFRKNATGMTFDNLTAKILALLIWPANFTHKTAAIVKELSYHHQLHVYFHLNFGREIKKNKNNFKK